MSVRSASLAFLVAACFAATPGAAMAQDAECANGASLLKARQGLMAVFQGGGKKPKMTAAQACSRLGGILANGQRIVAWHKQHGSWCNAPDSLVTAIQGQNAQVANVRAKACGAASQQKKMETLARQQQQNPQNPFGGDDVTGGPRKLPQGAL